MIFILLYKNPTDKMFIKYIAYYIFKLTLFYLCQRLINQRITAQKKVGRIARTGREQISPICIVRQPCTRKCRCFLLEIMFNAATQQRITCGSCNEDKAESNRFVRGFVLEQIIQKTFNYGIYFTAINVIRQFSLKKTFLLIPYCVETQYEIVKDN